MDGPNEINVDDHEAMNIGRATGKENGIPPWTSFVQKPEDFFNVDQVPDGFTLLDPSKMKDPQVQELLDFWHKRQEEGEDGIGFQFQESSSSVSRKRRRADSVADSSTAGHKAGKKEKGKGKAVDKEMMWTDHIQPDSRRRQTRKPGAGHLGLDSSGEEFDFSQLSEAESSEDEPQDTTTNDCGNHGQASSHASKGGHLAKVKGGTRHGMSI